MTRPPTRWLRSRQSKPSAVRRSPGRRRPGDVHCTPPAGAAQAREDARDALGRSARGGTGSCPTAGSWATCVCSITWSRAARRRLPGLPGHLRETGRTRAPGAPRGGTDDAADHGAVRGPGPHPRLPRKPGPRSTGADSPTSGSAWAQRRGDLRHPRPAAAADGDLPRRPVLPLRPSGQPRQRQAPLLRHARHAQGPRRRATRRLSAPTAASPPGPAGRAAPARARRRSR